MSKKKKIQVSEDELLRQEIEQANVDALQFSKKRFKHFDYVIMQLYEGVDLSRYFSDTRISKVHHFFLLTSGSMKDLLKSVLVYLCKYSTLIDNEDGIQAVYNIVRFKQHWLQDLFSWRPTSKRINDQVKEIATYLFCRYKVPDFLVNGFYESGNLLFIKWFIHIGAGRKIKELKNMPIPYTHKIGHHFLNAPAALSVYEALRWAQVRGLGGSEQLAKRVAHSWIGTKPYDDEKFWERFLQIVIQGGMFNYAKLTEVIDYVRTERRENMQYSLKGRTLQSLLKQSDTWHKRFSIAGQYTFWRQSGIGGYEAGKKIDMVILKELTESKDLVLEGRQMHHCVASYAYYCAKGRSAIFSLRRYYGGLYEDTLATIEVNLAMKRIVQAKAKMNKAISNEAKKHIMVWAVKERLTISQYV